MTIKSPEHLLNNIAVRIETCIKGTLPKIAGSGVIYYTVHGDLMYVFTALHCILGKRENDPYGKFIYKHEISDVEYVTVSHNPKLDAPSFTNDRVLPEQIIVSPSYDFCILKVKKKLVEHIPNFPRIVLHKNKRIEGLFRSAGYTSLNRDTLTFINYRNPQTSPDGVIQIVAEGIQGESTFESISGYSGSGLFMVKGSVLVGIITKLNDDNAFANNVHARDLSLIDINKLLRTENINNELVSYTNDANHIFNTDNGDLIDLSRVIINEVGLNLWKAVGNIKKDIADDWFQDPQRMKDFFFSETIYKLVNICMVNGKYEPSAAELFNIPKEGFTTRKAIQTSLIDRVVFQAAVDYVASELDNKVIRENVYSVRYNYNTSNNNDYFFYNSVEQWRKFQYQIHDSLTDEMPYLVVTDITSFYDNITADNLNAILVGFREKVANRTEYDRVVSIIDKQIRKWQRVGGRSSNGIPQNREPSAFLANLFLAKVDNHMINAFPNYYRYMDDIRIICRSKFEARKALMMLIDQLNEIGLNLNSQKTKILYKLNEIDQEQINEYTPALDKQIEQICSLMNSGKSRDVQISVVMVNDMFHESIVNAQNIESRKKFKFTIERLQRFARTPILCELINFSEIVQAIVERFEDNPWYTEIYTRFLMTISADYITKELIELLVPLVVDPERNIYPWQSYQIMRLLAYHKIEQSDLKRFANNIVNQPQGLDKAPVVAGACLYLNAVDANATGTIKSAFQRGHFKSHLANRCALVCLQTVEPFELEEYHINKVMEEIHRQAHEKYKQSGNITPCVYGFPKLKINQISRDLPEVISLT